MRHDAEEIQERLIGLEWDSVPAHRGVAAHPNDRGLQAGTLADSRGPEPGDEVDGHANTGGTFGHSTAGHWWGRPAARRTRLAHYALGRELAGRIRSYADDGQLRSQQERSGGLPRPGGPSTRRWAST